MIYAIRRTSNYNDENSPCEGAVKRKFEYWHTRTVNEDEFNAKFSNREGLWRSKGKNHTVTSDGYITRQEDDMELWSVEINSLDDLLDIVNKHGEVIVS